MSAAFGAWLRRQREARGWSRNELARRMADAAGSAVTAPAHVLECYLSRWEAGHVAISARYRQLLDAVLGPDANAPAAYPPAMPVPDPRQWVRAMRALESDIAGGGGTGTVPPPARNPRACARPDTRVLADAVTESGNAPTRSPADDGELPRGDGLPEFMLVKECAAQARVSLPTIYGLIRSGHVEAIRLGREFRIYTHSWLAYLQAPRRASCRS